MKIRDFLEENPTTSEMVLVHHEDFTNCFWIIDKVANKSVYVNIKDGFQTHFEGTNASFYETNIGFVKSEEIIHSIITTLNTEYNNTKERLKRMVS